MDFQAIVDRLKAESIDYYATLRSGYRQDRRAEIRNGEPFEDDENGDEFFEEFEEFEGLNEGLSGQEEAAILNLEF